MGNCLFGGVGDDYINDDVVIKVITSDGGIMEFCAPTAAESITDEFPGHAIFRSHDLFWKPIPHHEVLLPGNSYYLLPLPLNSCNGLIGIAVGKDGAHQMPHNHHQLLQLGHIRSNSEPNTIPSAAAVAPYRMSFDHHRSQKLLKRTTTTTSSSSCGTQQSGRGRLISKHKKISTTSIYNNNRGIWKVKLVISPKQLMEILSQEIRTQELIESVRTVAKCGGGGASSLAALSEYHWTSLSSSTSNKVAS